MAISRKATFGFGAAFIAIWIVGWTFGAVSVDIRTFRDLVSQIHSAGFSRTSGKILNQVLLPDH